MQKFKKIISIVVFFLMLVPFVSWAQGGQNNQNGVHNPGTDLENPELKEAMPGSNQRNQVKANLQTTQGTNRIADIATQRRSRVANAVQQMLQVAERNQGLGQRIRTIAQAQNQNQEQIEAGLNKIENRGRLRKFFFGPDYKSLNSVKDRLANHEERIAELKEVASQMSNEADAQILEDQIATMEQVKAELEEEMADQSSGFSLFGWLMKRFAK